MDQWNRIASPETNPHAYGQLISNRGGKNIQWRKDSLFSNGVKRGWTAACNSNSMKFKHTLIYPYTKQKNKLKNGLKT